MPKYPKIGMKYSQAIKTAKRHAQEGSMNLVESMTNQVRLHEGDASAAEFYRDATQLPTSKTKYGNAISYAQWKEKQRMKDPVYRLKQKIKWFFNHQIMMKGKENA